MPFIVDLLPPSAEIEAASALGLAMAGRKSKGLLGRKQYESIEVIARFALPLKTALWRAGEGPGRCLAFDPHGFVSGGVKFELSAKAPEAELDSETGEEAFVGLCQQWTKAATDFSSANLDFPGLIVQPDQVIPLLGTRDEDVLIAEFEQKADIDGTLAQLTEQLEAYSQAGEAWQELRQRAFAHRDVLASKIQQYAQEEKDAGQVYLEELSGQIQTAIENKRNETNAGIANAKAEYEKRKEMLKAELARFQEGFKENGDSYWRDQIKTAEKKLVENDSDLAKRTLEIESGFKDFEKQQHNRIKEFKAELEKRLAALEARQKRLDTTLDGFGKGIDKRLATYARQPSRVDAITVELSAERCATAHTAVFYAIRYPGQRWVVLPPQVLESRGLRGAMSSLLGGLNLPFKPASKLAETLAEKVQKSLPGSELESKLVETNQLDSEDFKSKAKAGVGKLIDQGKLDKKYADLFNESE